ncbi:MAG: DUF1616 domain-containing protein [Candidatus Heimdallarchaeota archaeon]|nr:DUF1616 domain-containing protein [Candidatus Heimdallarchaeota archaeon]MCK4255098.1 DUF1616 domain-containing protein [Candidatus Heimdallarchaeota archaeon]
MNSVDISGIKKVIQKIMNEDKPKTVKQLVTKTVTVTGKEEREIYLAVQELEKTNIIKLGSSKIKRELPKSVHEYLFRNKYFVVEFWTLLILISMFVPVGLFIPADSFFSFLRIIFGVLFGLFIPGWIITNLIFPKLYENIDQLERVLLAVGMNIGIIIFSGLILNAIWLIDSAPFVIIIGSFSLFIHLLSVVVRILLGSKTLKVKSKKILTKLSEISFFKNKVRNDEK